LSPGRRPGSTLVLIVLGGRLDGANAFAVAAWTGSLRRLPSKGLRLRSLRPASASQGGAFRAEQGKA
jgi:hypothetical protein